MRDEEDFPVMSAQFSRAAGALYGLAIGDALGMPTQDLTAEQINTDYGAITDFVPAGPNQLIATGQQAGTITDDTEQMLLLAELLTQHGRIEPHTFATALARWEDDMRARGSLDLLGPSTRAAIDLIRDGVSPREAGRNGVTNGAAMRIAPVGVATPLIPFGALVDRVVEASGVTHNTSLGISSAAAVAAAVSAGIDGSSRTEAIDHAMAAAEAGAQRGRPIPGPSIAARIRWAVEYLPTQADPSRAIYRVIGTTVAAQESVVAALAISATVPNVWDGLCLAASAGGDTDTVAAIVGAIRGATDGIESFPPHAVPLIRTVNSLDLDGVTTALLQQRAERQRP